ncbi:Pyroglutamyl-peptidase 1, partial [Stegodyphus mimosarum]
MGDLSSIPTVLVTGFGPFRNHTQNSSWLTVKELLKLNITDYHIVAKELPVEYDTVSEIVPVLWEEYNPKLVVHCGMSDQANCLTIEKLAHRNDYYGCDMKGQVPSGYTCCCDGPDVLYTSIDVQKVLDDVHGSGACVKAEASEDAGLYLCEFIFYTSLKINRNTAFVHIPPIGQPYSAREMAETLAVIIHSMLKQVQSSS